MDVKELLLASDLLKVAADEFSHHGCNDWAWPEDWTESFIERYHAWNGDPEEAAETRRLYDHAVMSFLSAEIKAVVDSPPRGFRVRWRQAGVHFHCRVYESLYWSRLSETRTTFALNGELTFDERSWPVFRSLLEVVGVEFLEDPA